MKHFSVFIFCAFLAACSAADVDSTGDVDAGHDVDERDPGTDTRPSMPDADESADVEVVDAADAVDPGPVDTSPLDVMNRPADVLIPDDYDRSTSYPLVVLLHGYTADGDIQDNYFGVGAKRTERGFILVKPDGTRNPQGQRYWNAMWCCDVYDENVDDVAYISGLITAAKERFNVDERRVYLLGHSNGGFMSYRMACDVDGITAIASLAGSGWLDASDCPVAGGPVAVLQIHGTLDGTIRYNGLPAKYPSAPEMARRWVERNGCDPEPEIGPSLDIDRGLPGAETTPEVWSGCDDETSVALWTIEAGVHIPAFQPEFIDLTLDFLFAHSSPE